MKQLHQIICNGPSMKPTIMPGDMVETEEADFEALRPGNIIVYNSPENIRLNIIHRVIGRDADGLITRGDNNSFIDPYRVRAEHRPARAVAVTRGTRRIPVSRRGMLQYRRRVLQRKWRMFAIRFLHPIYAGIADSGIFFPLGFFLKTEVREFKRPGGTEQQLFSGRRRIGTLSPNTEKWRIRFPWRLFIKPPTEIR